MTAIVIAAISSGVSASALAFGSSSRLKDGITGAAFRTAARLSAQPIARSTSMSSSNRAKTVPMPIAVIHSPNRRFSITRPYTGNNPCFLGRFV